MKVKATRYYKGKPLIETDFLETKEGVVELIRTTGSEFVLMYYRGAGVDSVGGQYLHYGTSVLCPPNEDEVTRRVRFSHRLSAYESVGELLQKVYEFIGRCLDLDDDKRFLFACFVLSTWMVDHLPVAPYLAFVGVSASGKSTALRILYLLCRRGLITSDISSAAFYRACDRLTATLLFDDASTAPQQKALFHLLRSGTTRDAVALRGGDSFRAFGAKAMAWRELPDDDALNSRCLIIPMRETSRTDLLPTTAPEVIEAADLLQGQLLRYRLEKCRTLSLPQVPGAEHICSRDRDIYEALALPIGEDLPASARLVECLAKERDSNREPLPPNETAIVETLFEQIHLHPDQGTYAIRHLTLDVNSDLQRSGERFRLNAKAVGAVLTTLGFPHRKRTNLGFVVWFDSAARKRIHELMVTYGMDAPDAHLPSEAPKDRCEFCSVIDPERSEPSPTGPPATEPTTEPRTEKIVPESTQPNASEHSEYSEHSEHSAPDKSGDTEFIRLGDRELIEEMIPFEDQWDHSRDPS